MGKQVRSHAVILSIRRTERLATARLYRQGGRRSAAGDVGGTAVEAAPDGLGG